MACDMISEPSIRRGKRSLDDGDDDFAPRIKKSKSSETTLSALYSDKDRLDLIAEDRRQFDSLRDSVRGNVLSAWNKLEIVNSAIRAGTLSPDL